MKKLIKLFALFLLPQMLVAMNESEASSARHELFSLDFFTATEDEKNHAKARLTQANLKCFLEEQDNWFRDVWRSKCLRQTLEIKDVFFKGDDFKKDPRIEWICNLYNCEYNPEEPKMNYYNMQVILGNIDGIRKTNGFRELGYRHLTTLENELFQDTFAYQRLGRRPSVALNYIYYYLCLDNIIEFIWGQ